MSYQFYLVLHFIGLLLFFVSFGGMVVNSLMTEKNEKVRKQLSVTHGLGLLVIIVSGFGLLAKAGFGFQGWVIVKIVIWLIFGASIVFLKKPKMNNVVWNAVILLGFIAVYLAVFKPF